MPQLGGHDLPEQRYFVVFLSYFKQILEYVKTDHIPHLFFPPYCSTAHSLAN
jgi:hypothetical protein